MPRIEPTTLRQVKFYPYVIVTLRRKQGSIEMNDDRTSQTLLGQLKQDSSQSAWIRFNNIYGPLIFSWLRRRGVPEEVAEDVRQEVMMKLISEIRNFDHNGRTGAFRSWLKLVMVHRLRTIQRRSYRPAESNSADFSELADQLADDASEISRVWDAEHDKHVIDRLLEIVASEFQQKSMTAFRRVVMQSEDPELVATELGMTVNAVRIAQSRVLAALRRIGEGFLD
jgi:RNA polymerase sigma factor (sigma-70 family)